MATASLKAIIDIEQKISGEKNAANKLEATTRAIRQEASAIRELERVQRRLKKSGDDPARLARINQGLARRQSTLAGMTDELIAMRSGAVGSTSAIGGLGAKAAIAGAAIAAIAIAARAAWEGVKRLAAGIKDAAVFSANLQFSLTRFLGSSAKATRAIADVLALSNKYGLAFQQAGENFKDFVSAGFTTEAAKELLLLKADLQAMSTGSAQAQQKIESAFADIGKAMAAGRIEADGFNRILENLPVTKMDILTKLAPKLNKSVAELAKMDITKLPVQELVEAIKEATLDATGATELGATALKKQQETLTGALNALKNRAGNFLTDIATKLEGNKGIVKLINQITAAFDSPRAQAIAQGIADAIMAVGDALVAAAPYVEAVVQGFEEGFGAVRPIVDAAFEAVSALFGTADSAETLRTVLVLVGRALGGIAAAVAVAVAGLGVLAGAFVKYLGAVQSVISSAYELGSAIVNGIVNGIKNGAAAVISAVTGVSQGAINAAKSALKIKSPSRVFEEIGAYTGEGFTRGLEGEGDRVARATSGILAQPAATASQITNSNRSSVGNITINVQGGGAAKETAGAIRAELVALFEGVSLAPQGAPA